MAKTRPLNPMDLLGTLLTLNRRPVEEEIRGVEKFAEGLPLSNLETLIKGVKAAGEQTPNFSKLGVQIILNSLEDVYDTAKQKASQRKVEERKVEDRSEFGDIFPKAPSRPQLANPLDTYLTRLERDESIFLNPGPIRGTDGKTSYTPAKGEYIYSDLDRQTGMQRFAYNTELYQQDLALVRAHLQNQQPFTSLNSLNEYKERIVALRNHEFFKNDLNKIFTLLQKIESQMKITEDAAKTAAPSTAPAVSSASAAPAAPASPKAQTSSTHAIMNRAQMKTEPPKMAESPKALSDAKQKEYDQLKYSKLLGKLTTSRLAEKVQSLLKDPQSMQQDSKQQKEALFAIRCWASAAIEYEESHRSNPRYDQTTHKDFKREYIQLRMAALINVIDKEPSAAFSYMAKMYSNADSNPAGQAAQAGTVFKELKAMNDIRKKQQQDQVATPAQDAQTSPRRSPRAQQ